MRSIAAVVKVDRVSTVEVLALRGAVRISGVDCSCVVGAVKHEVIGMFAETIEVRLLREMCLEVDILALEDQLLTGSVEKNFSGVGAGYCEREWIRLEIELKL